MNQNWYSAFRELAHSIKEHVCSFFPCRICHPAYVSCRWPLLVDWVNVLYCNIPKVSSGDSWQWNGLRQWTASACLKLFCHSQGWIGWSRSHSPKKGGPMAISFSCPPSLAFGVSAWEIWQGQSKRCHLFWKSTLAFCRPVPVFVVLLRCFGEALDWQSEVTVIGRPVCLSALNQNCSLGFSPPWCVSSLESDL